MRQFNDVEKFVMDIIADQQYGSMVGQDILSIINNTLIVKHDVYLEVIQGGGGVSLYFKDLSNPFKPLISFVTIIALLDYLEGMHLIVKHSGFGKKTGNIEVPDKEGRVRYNLEEGCKGMYDYVYSNWSNQVLPIALKEFIARGYKTAEDELMINQLTAANKQLTISDRQLSTAKNTLCWTVVVQIIAIIVAAIMAIKF